MIVVYYTTYSKNTQMKPDRPGIWEWFDDNNTRRLVEVVDVCRGMVPQYLRVYFSGGYYNVHDEFDAEHPEQNVFMKAEWPDRWGNRIADNHGLPKSQLYLFENDY